MEQFYKHIMKELLESEAAAEQHETKTTSIEGSIKTANFDGCFSYLFSHPGLKRIADSVYNIHIRLKILFDAPDSAIVSDLVWELVSNVNFGQDSVACVMKKYDLMKCMDEDEIYNLIAFSGSLFAYMSMSLLDMHLKQIMCRIKSDIILWLTKIFRFPATKGYVCDTSGNGLVQICRQVLLMRYPDYCKVGFNALRRRTPIIYLSKKMVSCFQCDLCTQLSLPESSICAVATESSFVFSEVIDPSDFENLILQHEEEQKVPLLLVAYAGSTCMGQIDHLVSLQNICSKHGIWLHLEGNYLSTLSYLNAPLNIIPAQKADSMTLAIGAWLGLPQLPFVSLLNCEKQQKDSSTNYEICCSDGQLELNQCLSLWFVLQHLGQNGISRRIEFAFSLGEKINKGLQKISSIIVLKKNTKLNMKLEDESKRKNESLGEKIKRTINSFLIYQLPNPFIVFYYYPQREGEHLSDSDNGSRSGWSDDKDGFMLNHRFQAANEWLAAEILNRYGADSCQVTIVQIEKIGVCLRYCSLETNHAHRSQKANVEEFLKFIEEKSMTLDATFKYKSQLNLSPVYQI